MNTQAFLKGYMLKRADIYNTVDAPEGKPLFFTRNVFAHSSTLADKIIHAVNGGTAKHSGVTFIIPNAWTEEKKAAYRKLGARKLDDGREAITIAGSVSGGLSGIGGIKVTRGMSRDATALGDHSKTGFDTKLADIQLPTGRTAEGGILRMLVRAKQLRRGEGKTVAGVDYQLPYDALNCSPEQGVNCNAIAHGLVSGINGRVRDEDISRLYNKRSPGPGIGTSFKQLSAIKMPASAKLIQPKRSIFTTLAAAFGLPPKLYTPRVNN